MIGRVGASGEVHLARGKAWVSDNCLMGFLNYRVDPAYIYYLLKYINLQRFITQTAQPLITQSFVANILLPLPPLPEQERIVSVLSQVDEVIEKEQAYKEKLERMKKGMMEDLLTGKVRVNSLIKEG